MTDFSRNLLEECIASVKNAQTESRKRGDPHGAVRAYFDLFSVGLGKVILLPEEGISEAVDSLNSSQLAFLRGISTSGAIWGVREQSRDWLLLGIRGLYLEGFANDPRETATKLAIIGHSATKIGVELTQLIDDAFKSIGAAVPGALSVHKSGPVPDLAAVGYKESIDSEGKFTYVRD